VLLIIAVMGGIIGFKAFLYIPEVAVPNLIGKGEDEAQKIIEDLGLEFKIADREFNNDYEVGEVIEQVWRKAKKLKEGYPVEVIVSKGEEEITVPNLIGRYAIEAGNNIIWCET